MELYTEGIQRQAGKGKMFGNNCTKIGNKIKFERLFIGNKSRQCITIPGHSPLGGDSNRYNLKKGNIYVFKMMVVYNQVNNPFFYF